MGKVNSEKSCIGYRKRKVIIPYPIGYDFLKVPLHH